jgi:hypothetical protein
MAKSKPSQAEDEGVNRTRLDSQPPSEVKSCDS